MRQLLQPTPKLSWRHSFNSSCPKAYWIRVRMQLNRIIAVPRLLNHIMAKVPSKLYPAAAAGCFGPECSSCPFPHAAAAKGEVDASQKVFAFILCLEHVHHSLVESTSIRHANLPAHLQHNDVHCCCFQHLVASSTILHLVHIRCFSRG